MDKALVFLYPLVLFYRFGGNGRRGFTGGRVVLLNVSSGSGDGSPCFATRSSDADCAKDERKCQYVFLHDFAVL